MENAVADTLVGCKWRYGDWEPLTPQSWSSGSREFQRESADHVETVRSSLGGSAALDPCQTEGFLIAESSELVNWDIKEVILAQSCIYLVIFAMKTFMLRNAWSKLNKEVREMDNSPQTESLSQEVKRVEKPSLCTQIMGCFLKLEILCEKIQSPFFFCFITFMPAYILAPLLQATCHEGYIIAPAADVWTIRTAGWWMLAASLWWFCCQILTQCFQRCKILSQFCNVVSMGPIAALGAYIIYYEMEKLGRKGFGFEFILFFKHMFSFSFSFGLEMSVDFLQLLFSFTVAVDAIAGLASVFTKRDWKEKCIFSYLVRNSKAMEPAEKPSPAV